MSTRSIITAGLLLSMPGVAGAQSATDSGAVPRTTWGAPDLRGVWNHRSLTPLERPDQLAGQEVLTEEEAAALEQQAVDRRLNGDRPAPRPGTTGAYNQFWFPTGGKVVSTYRTSLIVDPPDGRLPSLTPEAERRVEAHRAAGGRPHRQLTGGIGGGGTTGDGKADSWEDRGLAERCLQGIGTGPPMTSGPYNNIAQLFQTPDYVVIVNEMVHDARIVPLDDRPHLPDHMRHWMGDSRGHWEGDTLVVDTTNFTHLTASFNTNLFNAIGSAEELHLTERFSRRDADTLLYQFTIDDPATFTRPFTVELPMRMSDGALFEYACHEGNYALPGILGGARALEAAAENASR